MNSNINWSSAKKISFRFFFTYFLLFIFTYGNGAFPFYQLIQDIIDKALYQIVPWIGKNILNISYTIKTGPNGSGDTTYNYVLIFTLFSIAIISTIVWSLVDKKSTHYKKLYYWLTMFIRFYVGLMLINYGLIKVIKLQFSSPDLYRLTQPFGEASPMGLAWTFLGFSDGYNLFMGIAEIMAVFLLFRRTLTAGAIITLMTTLNVMAINYFFDIPVKILSTHLVLMTLFLLAHNFTQLWQFFFKKKAVLLSEIYKPLFKPLQKNIFLVLKVLLLIYVLPIKLYETHRQKEMYYGKGSESYLKGFYEVDEFIVNDTIILCDSSEVKKWKNLMIEEKDYALISTNDNKKSWYQLKTDSIKKEIVLKSYRDSLDIYTLKYIQRGDTTLNVKGSLKNKQISIKMKRTKDYNKKFLLTNRGFHWINEYPFNR